MKPDRIFFAIVRTTVLCGTLVCGPRVHCAEEKPSAAVAADSPVPAPPPGFKSSAEAIAAIALKKVKLIDLKTALPEGVQEQQGVEYGKVGDLSLLLDLYLPKAHAKPVPGLIFIHGGAFVRRRLAQ